MSASVSRRVMKAMLVPGRCESWTTWPSTHNPGIRLMYSAILAARCRTGQGVVGEVSIARGTRGRAAVVAVTGAAVTGAAVTGAAVVAVTGAAVTGAAVTGAAPPAAGSVVALTPAPTPAPAPGVGLTLRSPARGAGVCGVSLTGPACHLPPTRGRASASAGRASASARAGALLRRFRRLTR